MQLDAGGIPDLALDCIATVMLSGNYSCLFLIALLTLQAAILCHASQIPPPRNRPGRTQGRSSRSALNSNDRDSDRQHIDVASLDAPESRFSSAVAGFQAIQKQQLALAASNNASARVLVYRICCGEMGNRFLV